MLQLGRAVQRRGVAAVGAIIAGKFRTIVFKCRAPNLNSQHANTKVLAQHFSLTRVAQ